MFTKGPSIKDVHKEGEGYSKSGQNVDMGEGVLKLKWTSTNFNYH